MTAALITPPTLEPVTLADAKAHLRIDGDDDDDLSPRAIVAARSHVESLTRRGSRAGLAGLPRRLAAQTHRDDPVAPLIPVDG